jgi:glucosylceramidase
MKSAIFLAIAACLVADAQQVQVYETYGDQSKLLEKRSAPLAFNDNAVPGSGIAIRIDGSATFQTIDGFGASLTDSAASVIQKLDPAARQALMLALFSPTRGAGISLLRQPMGASDFSSRGNYSYQETETGTFSIAPDLEFTIPLLKEAQRLNPGLRILALPWSPPGWMKTGGSMNGGGVRSDRFDALAQYFVNFLSAYKARGLPIYAVSMQNEPMFQTAAYPSSLVSAADETAFLSGHLGPALAAAGFGSTRIIAYDHNWDHPEYPDAVESDAAAAQFVSGAAFHCYGGDVSAQLQLHANHPDKDIWFTECSGTVGSSFAGDLAWNARNLVIGAVRNWARGVTLWNIALDQNSGPKNGGCDKCRGVVTVDTSVTPMKVTRNVEYYVLAHAAKFVRAGARRIDSTSGAGGILSVAFRNPDGSIAAIVLNDGAAVSDFSVSLNGRSFVHTLPPQSLATFVWIQPVLQ